jgi:hypothetical protein
MTHNDTVKNGSEDGTDGNDGGCGGSEDVDRMLSDFLLELNCLSDALGMREEVSGEPGAPALEQETSEAEPTAPPAPEPPRYRNIDILLMEKTRLAERKEKSGAEPPPEPSVPPPSPGPAGLGGRIRGLFRK